MAGMLKGEFLNPHSEGVVFGPGSSEERLSGLLARKGAKRVFLISTPSIARMELLKKTEEAAGSLLAGTFAESCANTPRSVVLTAAVKAREAGADLLISLGGSSVIDLTKAVALVLAEGEDFDAHRIRFDSEGAVRTPVLEKKKLPHIALPTTLSGSEFTSILAVKDEEHNRKDFFVDKKLTPSWVILDPVLTKHTPDKLWFATGMKALADSLEEICSTGSTPYSEALGLRALKILYGDLIPSAANPDDAVLRGRVQFASFMSATNIMNTGLGIVASLRQQLGAHGVAHGIASTIVLPHCLRWNLPYAKEALSGASMELRLSEESSPPEDSARKLIDAVERLTEKLGLPTRLRDVDVPSEALHEIAEKSSRNYVAATNPRPVNSADELMEILEAAW